MKKFATLVLAALVLSPALASGAEKQAPPAPAKPKNFSLPAPRTIKLDNGLAVTLVPYGTTPKVTVRR